jgi:transcription antitermination protein NusB
MMEELVLPTCETGLQELVKSKYDYDADSEDNIIRRVFTVSSRKDERVVALCLLYALDSAEYEIPIEDIMANISCWFDISFQENSYGTLIVYGVFDNKDAISCLIIPLLKSWKLERVSCLTRLILYIAVWELQHKEAIYSIVINEAVELAKLFAEDDAYKFVNGILDEFCKQYGKKDECGKEKIS